MDPVSSEQVLIETIAGTGTTTGSSNGDATVASAASTASPSGSASAPAKRKPEDFRFGKLIGEGSFSSVYLAKDVKNGNECAIKVCTKQLIIREKKAELIKREKEVMTILSAHRDSKIPFFVKLHATFQDTERLYFVMTYARGGELLKYITRKPEKIATHFFNLECCQFYMGELVVALAHLHSLNIIHRDLKPENILLDAKGHILITDFGSAKILNQEKADDTGSTTNTNVNGNNSSAQSGDSAAAPASDDQSPRRPPLRRSNSFVGTAQYVSPEVLQGKYSEVGPAADLWALGCIMYQLTFGSPPFTDKNEYLIFQKILKLSYEFPEDVQNSPHARDMIERLLKLDHKERLGVQDVERYTSLESHPFFDGADIHTFCDRNPTPLYQYLTSSDDVETGEPIHANSYKVPDSFAPGFNPRIMAQRALQDEDDIPFSIPNANTGSNLTTTNTKVENHSVTTTNTSTTKSSMSTTTNDHACKIIHQKDSLLNNAKNLQDANSNNDSGCGCKCTLF